MSPHFIQEYTNGDVCEGVDVTDTSIKGGSLNAMGGIERSTTVRFFCGKFAELVHVNEDSTCHYVIDVTVPALCHHPHFMAQPIPKKVVKSLPVENK